MVDIAELGEEEEDPEESHGQREARWDGRGRDSIIPVDLGDGGAQAEWSGVLVGLFPDLMAVLDVVWRVDGIVEAHDDHQSPREGNEHTMACQGDPSMRFPFSEGIIYGALWSAHDSRLTRRQWIQLLTEAHGEKNAVRVSTRLFAVLLDARWRRRMIPLGMTGRLIKRQTRYQPTIIDRSMSRRGGGSKDPQGRSNR